MTRIFDELSNNIYFTAFNVLRSPRIVEFHHVNIHVVGYEFVLRPVFAIPTLMKITGFVNNIAPTVHDRHPEFRCIDIDGNRFKHLIYPIGNDAVGDVNNRGV